MMRDRWGRSVISTTHGMVQFPKMTRNLWEQTISSENLHENLHDVVKILISISSMLL